MPAIDGGHLNGLCSSSVCALAWLVGLLCLVLDGESAE